MANISEAEEVARVRHPHLWNGRYEHAVERLPGSNPAYVAKVVDRRRRKAIDEAALFIAAVDQVRSRAGRS